MKDISQETILRMVGLRDGAHLMRQLNAIQLSLEEQDGQMVAYWTEIQKDERQISLIAGRVSANETSIGQLQVTAQSLTASVSSLTTTVSGHTTKIASLELTDQSLTASVSSLTTQVNGIDGTVSGHTTKIASLELTDQSLTASVSSLTTQVNGIDGTVSTHTTKIASLELTDQSLTASVSSLNTTVGTHTTKIASLELTDTSISNRVTAIEGDYVKEAEISLMVKKDGNGYISNASIKADRIDFTFTQSTNFVSNGTTVMNINSSGDLWIKGDLKGGNIQGDYTIGTQGTKMQIYVDETIGSARSSGIRGVDSNNWEVIRLGMLEYNNRVEPSLRLNNPSVDQVYVRPEFIQFNHTVNTSVTSVFTIGWSSTTNKILIGSPLDAWPSLSNVSVGEVYLDNGYLKVRTS